ncbi:RNA-directed DNA polymerase from mobile element jockey [Plakobranchus ocellatus]|uniref:RNA-directed DNA polymerase from mobile element jockey n=1 Tax=Plakobranchus ocellatus TaxID=259542 RepID=A0AAV4A9U3_9GAST|nr:RNA-directed DNA polymerase from mobile element jockey [Plakobranchus ocellatus]
MKFIARRGPCGLGCGHSHLLKALPHTNPVQVGLRQCVHGSVKKHVLRALDPVHHQGVRIVLGAFRTPPIKSLYDEAGEPSLEHRRTKLAFNCTKIKVFNAQSVPQHCI